MTTQVLACIDASPYAQAVCDYAVWAAKQLSTPVTLVHVLDKALHTQTPDLSGSIGLGSQELLLQQLAELDEKHSKLALQRGRLILDAARQQIEQAGVTSADERLRHGQLLDTLTELESQTRLLVLGKRGFSSADAHGHMGLHVERVIRSVHKPILLTQQQFKTPQRIMLAFDGSATAVKSAQMLAASPLLRGLPLHLVMVGQDSDAAQQQIAAAATVRDSAERFTTQLIQAYIAGAGLLLLLIGGLIWAVQRSVCRPLWALRDMLNLVQQSSDLTLRANDHSADEVADAARALNQMIDHFEQLVVKLGHSSTVLGEQAALVFQSSDNVSQSAVRQAGQASQLATAVEQMSVSVQDVAVNAKGAAAAAQQAQSLCAAGQGVATASAAGITELARQLDHSAQVVRKLQQESGQISGVVDVIRKISEQTNLLALNAAIEAARAGEAGRGFSVVADEVRTLSANTQQATESINSMVSQLQQQAASAVEAMQQAYKDADSNVQLAQDAGARFTELAGAVEKITDANLTICSATEQQQVVSAEIAQNIHLLNGDITQLSDSAGRAAQASEQLNGLATQLSDDWQVFKVATKPT